MGLLQDIISNAKELQKTIILPEGDTDRMLKAADVILNTKIAKIILVGNPEVISQKVKVLGLTGIAKAEIVNPLDHPKRNEMKQLLFELRKGKGLTLEQADDLVNNPLYLAPLMIKAGYADGEVAGSENATGDVLRPAFQIVKTAPNSSVVSGAFIMIVEDSTYGEDGIMVFADCAVNPNPTAKQLAEIAVASAETAKKIAKIDPKVAMLSFSTMGSGKHEDVDKVIEATKLAKEMAPDLAIDGELQADAAIVESVGRKKAPNSKVAGLANVLVFPTLDAGNIGYKLVQRLAGAQAIGPVLQGMAAPINDLSRGCSVDDIVNLVAITANQAQEA
ncbi:MAG: phosphate acetyltransferase [Bacteroidetes bacterium]|nr:MAG: phosphate acetyltransferase [Bacteroidota bacterium]